MTTQLRLRHWILAMTAGSLPLCAAAQEKGCVELKTAAEMEQTYINEKGEKATRIVPAAKIVPGEQVIWTITARNVCNKPAENVVIANPIPEHMTYIADSASGVGTQITYSLDGKVFAAPDALKVQEADGTSRLARPDEYRYVRWVYQNPFPPGSVAFVRYRAVVD